MWRIVKSINPTARNSGPAGCVTVWGYGIILFMIGAFAGLTGLASLMVLPLVASGIFVGAFILGLVFHLSWLRSIWQRSMRLAVLCVCVGAGLYVFGLSSIQWPEVPPEVDPDETPLSSAGAVTYLGLFLVVFGTLHWPVKTEYPAA